MGSWRVSPAERNEQNICKHSLKSTPSRSSAFAGQLGFLTQKIHKCPSILVQHAAASNQTPVMRTPPNVATSRLEPSSCFVQTVRILMASFIKCLRKASETLDRSKVFLV